MTYQEYEQMSQKYMYVDDEKSITKRKIGKGREANIYRVSKDLAIKIYHRSLNDISNIADNDADIKTSKPRFFKTPSMHQSLCYDEEGVRLSFEDVIYNAKFRQKNIDKTFLPLNPLYIHNTFRGCIIKYHRNYFPISYFNCLPKKLKFKICYNILEKIKELLDNNIYQIDLYNKQDNIGCHNNIIINPTLDAQIIDLDGKSTIYTSSFDRDNYQTTLLGFSLLMLEFVYDEDLRDCFEEFYTYQQYYIDFFHDNKKIPREYIENILSDNISIDGLEDFLRHSLSKK